jgi:hypothetical protein
LACFAVIWLIVFTGYVWKLAFNSITTDDHALTTIHNNHFVLTASLSSLAIIVITALRLMMITTTFRS